jgi:archaemetzincin
VSLHVELHSALLDEERRARIVLTVARELDASVEWIRVSPPIQRAFDATRAQYHSTTILEDLQRNGNVDGQRKILALVDVDLFIPVLTFVFGEAQLNGPCAVISTARLKHEFYGLPANEAEFESRVEKEIIHELGHTLGLYHCRNFECVMRSSTYVEEIDLKRARMCVDCKTKYLSAKTAFVST